jgi:hypothetical protein
VVRSVGDVVCDLERPLQTSLRALSVSPASKRQQEKRTYSVRIRHHRNLDPRSVRQDRVGVTAEVKTGTGHARGKEEGELRRRNFALRDEVREESWAAEELRIGVESERPPQ